MTAGQKCHYISSVFRLTHCFHLQLTVFKGERLSCNYLADFALDAEARRLLHDHLHGHARKVRHRLCNVLLRMWNN